MKSAIDVHYIEQKAYVGVIEFDDWTDAAPKNIYRINSEIAGDYVPGQFYESLIRLSIRSIASDINIMIFSLMLMSI